mmetsp:Transcript_4885/g.11544  ORF Transcript_4885/g.11544 Transcript_4885/m.11544 type:complete len:352 (-) Transcript_4885:37-1092(-)
MALSFFKKATSRGAQEIASWSAKTYKFTFANQSNGSVKILLEEDPEGTVKMEEWKIGDGIPIVGKAEKRHARRVRELKKSILATSKPFQEFVLIRDQLKTVHMRSPVCKCSVGLTEWNGSLKLVEVQRQVSETETFVVHARYAKSPGYFTLRADLLEHALRAVGLQLGFDVKDLKDDESEIPDSTASKRASIADMASLAATTISTGEVESAAKPLTKAPIASSIDSETERTPSFEGSVSFHHGLPHSRHLPAVQEVPKAEEPWTQRARPPSAGMATTAPKGAEGMPVGFLPIQGQVLLQSSRRWLPAKLVGVSIGMGSVEGCLYVEYADPSGCPRRQMILPDQIPRMLRKV